MTVDGSSRDAIKHRIKPTLDKVSVEGLRSWLKTVGLTASARGRAAITELITDQIAQGKLTEPALEKALIGFEESSDMRIYLYRMGDDVPAQQAEQWMPPRLHEHHVPLTQGRQFAGHRSRPMSPVYGYIEGGELRVKWTEQQNEWKFNRETQTFAPIPVQKKVVLIADFFAKTAELRLNPPERIGGHSYTDGFNRNTADAYYDAYKEAARNLLGCQLIPSELRPVIRKLVEQDSPRVVRIHIDSHTNQQNYRTRTTGPRVDIRDSPEWQLGYREIGHTYAWDSQSFYWLPAASSGFLMREVFTHIDADDAFVKVNADCSEDEVSYVVSQIRAREAQ